MSEAAITWVAAAIAVAGAAWSALLVAAEESPLVGRTLGAAPTSLRAGVPVDRAIVIGRIALMLIAGVAGAEAVGWLGRPLRDALIAAGVTAGFLYVLGEAVPRAAAALSPQLANAAAPIARRSLVVFSPLFGLMSWLEGLLQAFLPPQRRGEDWYGPAHRDMVMGVLSLDETTVAEAMTPRLDIVAVDSASGWRDLVEQLRKSEHAQLPVFTDDLDTIIGVLDAKDLTPAVIGLTPPPENWLDLVRPARFVPESKLLSQQLGEFRRGPGRMAIVVDEFGGTSGLITQEDVLEEVVGEIYDEYDEDEEPLIKREGEDRLWVDGGVAVDDLADELGVSLESEDVTTVGGLIYSELGHVPRPGEELEIANFRVVVEQVIRRRVRRVYFERRGEPFRSVRAEEPE